MSRSFSPRRLDTDAWKGWHKDALRLMGRTGVVVVALWGLCMVGLAFLLNRLTGNSAVYQLRAGKPLPSGGGWKRGLLLMVIFR